jgi:GNAT superfamily N-acetyltransferase
LVRRAGRSDRDALASLIGAFRDHLGQSSPGEAEIRRSLDSLLEDPETEFLLAEGVGAPAGYAQVRYRHSLWVSGGEAQLEDLWVSEAERGRGVGACILAEVLERARARGCRAVRLDTNERNEAASRLYLRAGFSAARPRWPGGRQLWYERPLGAFFEAPGARSLDPAALVAGCIEQGARALLLDRDALPAAFFELSTGLAGELVQKLANYRIRMACVVPDLPARPARFREFAREANAGRELRFFATRREAVDWLEAP